MVDTTEITPIVDTPQVESAPSIPTTASEWDNAFSGVSQVPVVETAPIVEAPKGFYDRAREFVTDVDNEDALFERLKSYHEQLPTLQAKIQELEARKVEYPTQAAEELALFQQSLIAEGVTTREEFSKRSLEFMEENSRDYTKMAVENPAKVIEIALRKEYPNATPEQFALLMEDEGIVSPPRLDDYDGDETDPEYIKTLAAYNKSQVRLQLKAGNKIASLEAGKKKFDFQPKAIESKEDQEAAYKEYLGYLKTAGEKVSATTEITIGGEKFPIKVEGKLKEAFEGAIANPGGFERVVLGDADGRHDPAKFLEILAFPQILAQARDLAYRKGKSEVVSAHEQDLINSSRGQQPEVGGQQNGMPVTAADWDKVMQNVSQ